MSQDEQFIIQGRCLSEYAEVKKLLASLTAKADGMALALEAVIRYVRPSGVSGTGYMGGFTGKPPDLASYPAREELAEVFEEILRAKTRKRQLQDQLREYGADVRD